VVFATGAQTALVLLPSAREERKVENGATRVEATVTPVVVAAGARVPSAVVPAAVVLQRNLDLDLDLDLRLGMVSATGAQTALVLRPSAKEERKAENGATRVEATVTLVVVAAGALVPAAMVPAAVVPAAVVLQRNLALVSATGVQTALVLLPSAREDRKAENGATRVEATVTLVVVAAGARARNKTLDLDLDLDLFHLLRFRFRLFPRTPLLILAPATEEGAGVDLAETANASRWTAFLVMTTTRRWKGVEALSS
jgi:Flp pilus assembly pilin Flp